jgi:hypothetical protein
MELLVAAQFEPQPLHLLAQSSEWRHRPYQLHANLNTVSTVKAKQLNGNGGYWWILRVMEMLMELLVTVQFQPEPLHLPSNRW